MKFRCYIDMLRPPYLWGCSKNFMFGDYIESSCHEFYVSDVEISSGLDPCSPYSVNRISSEVTYIAGKYPNDNFLYGPASTRQNKTIIYP